MANNCLFDVKIAGKEEAVREFVQMLRWEGPFASAGLGRVFSFDLDEPQTERNPKDSSMIAVVGFGDCAWSVEGAIVNIEPKNLKSECLRLGIVAEFFSSEPNIRFQEHFLCNMGQMEIEDNVYYVEYVVDGATQEELQEYAEEEGITVEELKSKMNCNGEYTRGGIEGYADFHDLFNYFEDESTKTLSRKRPLNQICADAETRRVAPELPEGKETERKPEPER